MNIFFKFILTLLAIHGLVSCDKTIEANEEELITTVIYTLHSTSTNDNVTLKFSDLDGIGGIAPVIQTTGKFKVGMEYNGSISILNESINPIDDITEEVKDEGIDHQFFYEAVGGLANGLNFSYTDMDTDNLPIGITTKVMATKSGNGTLRITLRHQPDKKASGVSNGQILNAGGETDVEVNFDIEVVL